AIRPSSRDRRAGRLVLTSRRVVCVPSSPVLRQAGGERRRDHGEAAPVAADVLPPAASRVHARGEPAGPVERRPPGMSFIEVSHQVVPGMKTYPGLPEPSVDVVFDYDASRERYQGKAEFLIASLHLCGNTGTYVDSPIHRYRGGADLAGLPLERLADLETVVVDCSGAADRAIGPDALAGAEMRYRAGVVRRDFSLRWGTEGSFG